MAFGKDEKNLTSIGTFRQGARLHEMNKPRVGGGGGGVPYFKNAFKPSLEAPGDTIRIVKGTYDVAVGHQDGTITQQTMFYYPWAEHYHATLKKGVICSAGPLSGLKDKAAPCIGCEVFWGDKRAGKKNGPMSKSEKYAFTILHYATYGKVPQVDRNTGAVRTNDQGQPYTDWVHIPDHERRLPQYQNIEMRDHNLMHWSLGWGHWNVLIEYDKEIGRSCRTCGGRDTIQMEAWVCRGCGEALIEASTTTYSPKEIDQLTTAPVRCALCNHEGFLEEITSCKGCPNGSRADIFDVDLTVRRLPGREGTNQTTLAVTSWSNPRPIDARFNDIVKPLPLDKIFSPTPYEKQTEIFAGLAAGGGRAPVTAAQHSRPYGGGGGTPTLGGSGGGQGGGGIGYGG